MRHGTRGKAMVLSGIVFFFGFSVLGFLTCKNSALGMTKRISRKEKYYPRKYAAPPCIIKKFFRISKAPIPKFLLTELYFSLLFLILAPVSTLLCFISGWSPKIVIVLIAFYSALALFEFIHFLIGYFLFR